jgi:L-asparaginase
MVLFEITQTFGQPCAKRNPNDWPFATFSPQGAASVVVKDASPHVVLLATGGTIVSRTDAHAGAGALATDQGADLVGNAGLDARLPVRVVDVMRTGSYALTFTDMLEICAAIREALSDENALGVVVTHGTDTMEESAYLADLLYDDARPVVFTGAQRPADHPHPDGPANLRQAVAVAASPAARGQGVLLAFAGQIFRAAGVRKVHTSGAQAFGNPDGGSAGRVSDTGDVELEPPLPRQPALPWKPLDSSPGKRVDVIACHPGADGSLLRAALQAGSRGIVLQGTGNGNANPALVAAVKEATAAQVPVITTTRVHAGPVMPVYGAGGGKDLEAAGAVPAGTLKPAQALALLQVLVRLQTPYEGIPDAFAQRGNPHQTN